MPQKIKELLSKFLLELEEPQLDRYKVRKQAFLGCPEDLKGARPLV